MSSPQIHMQMIGNYIDIGTLYSNLISKQTLKYEMLKCR